MKISLVFQKFNIKLIQYKININESEISSVKKQVMFNSYKKQQKKKTLIIQLHVHVNELSNCYSRASEPVKRLFPKETNSYNR